MKSVIFFWKSFTKRSAFCFFVLIFLFFITILRLTATATGEYSHADVSRNKISLTADLQRGTLFDCNLIPLTNNEKVIIAAVNPTPKAVTAISQELSGEELNRVLEELKKGKPVLCQVKKSISCDGIVCTEIYKTSDNSPAAHILGYTDTASNGVSGLQKAYDHLLKSESRVKIIFEADGKGNALAGIEGAVEKDSSVEAEGIVTTIDINIQNIAERAANNLQKGAVIVAETETGKIKASVSRPDFNINNVSDFLNAEDSPLLNRAINAYNVGSVFKPCVAAAGIEANRTDFSYRCEGGCFIGNRFFRCHKYDGHGEMRLCSAIANSCNSYFYNFAFEIGSEKILNIAQKLRFGSELKLCDNLYASAGNLPSKNAIIGEAAVANLSIGQGELLLSPVSMLTLYNSIAANGKYYIPSIVEGALSNGSIKPYNKGYPTKAMEEETAKLLQNYLVTVLTEGTGRSAVPKNTTAAGKTATAQTGKYENGTEICQGWFCGFFPAENPKYTVIVFSEDTNRQTKSCVEIFSLIADEITTLEQQCH